jgi:hypothetical protein
MTLDAVWLGLMVIRCKSDAHALERAKEWLLEDGDT